MFKKDDFLIIGITGPFGSGCTTAAKFFEKDFEKIRIEYISGKNKVQADIVKWYKSDAKEKSKKEIIKLLRERQFINALENLKDVPNFYYISMTKIMNHLIIKSYLFNNLKVPHKEIKECLDIWFTDLPENLPKNELKKILNYLEKFKENKEIEKDKSLIVFQYFDEYLPKLKKIFQIDARYWK